MNRAKAAFVAGAVGAGIWAGSMLVPLAAIALMAVGGGFGAAWITQQIRPRRR